MKHGTKAAYEDNGCSCEVCKEYQRSRVARNRRERLESGNLTHGKRSSYDAGCRCDLCRAARREAYVRLQEYR